MTDYDGFRAVRRTGSPGVTQLSQVQIERKDLPKKAPELWLDRDRRLGEDAPRFVKRVYGPWLDKGLTRGDISKLDKSLGQAIKDWLIPQGRVWPEDVNLPTTQEWRDLAIATIEADPLAPIDPQTAEKLWSTVLRRVPSVAKR